MLLTSYDTKSVDLQGFALACQDFGRDTSWQAVVETYYVEVRDCFM